MTAEPRRDQPLSLRRSSIDTHTRSPLSASRLSVNDEVHSGRAWAQRVEEDPWDPLILTLDGGGIRGYCSLLILQQLMHEVARWENKLEAESTPDTALRQTFSAEHLLPCHYFDFMYGTSTGGLIATMLGRLRMTVGQCLREYRAVGNELFGHKRSKIPLATKDNPVPLEKAVRRIVRENCPVHGGSCDGADWHPWDVDAVEEDEDSQEPVIPRMVRICQSICLTATHSNRIDEAYLLRTYNHRYAPVLTPDGRYLPVPNWITIYNDGAEKLRIWQVTRATSAAPFYFKQLEVVIDHELKAFKDGGIRENNPSGAAWSEFVSLYGEEKNPALLLSVGTGRPNQQRDGFATAWPGPFGELGLVRKAAEKIAVFKNLLIKYTEGENRHVQMQLLARGQHTWYKRLNVSTGLEKMRLDDWVRGVWSPQGETRPRNVSGGSTLTRMEEATKAYLEREFDRHLGDTYAPPKVMIEQAAEKMVRHRRAREKTQKIDQKRWDTFMGKFLREEGAKANADVDEVKSGVLRSGNSAGALEQSTRMLNQSRHQNVGKDDNLDGSGVSGSGSFTTAAERSTRASSQDRYTDVNADVSVFESGVLRSESSACPIDRSTTALDQTRHTHDDENIRGNGVMQVGGSIRVGSIHE